MRAILLATLALAGCATTAKFQQNMNSWMGHSEAEIVGSMGYPASVYSVNDYTKVLTFSHSGQMVLPGQDYSTPVVTNTNGYVGSTNYHATSTMYVPQQGAPTVINLSCTVNVTITNGRATSWTANGNHCVS